MCSDPSRPDPAELTGSGHRLTFIPNRLADARMGDVIVVVAQLAIAEMKKHHHLDK